MKFAPAFIVSVLTSSVYGLIPALNVRENVDIEAREDCTVRQYAVPFFRAYSPSKVDHFYTIDYEEFHNAVTHLGYNDEGIAGKIYPSEEPETVPYYRLNNAAAGDHLYTTDVAERDNAAQNLGYVDEGVAGYVYPYSSCGSGPLYRLYSSAGQDHFYTMSVAERDNAKEHLGYSDEGISAYIFRA